LTRPLHLTRSDPARNMARFYRLDVQPDLFGSWTLVCEWGRIGQAGRVCAIPYPTADDASAAFERQRRAKQRRGYVLAGESGDNSFVQCRVGQQTESRGRQ
jgi:predicted DNA-binding WGR domain protein